jgi:hypothetical protein
LSKNALSQIEVLAELRGRPPLAGAVDEAVAPLDLDGGRVAVEQELDHARVDDVVGEAAVGALDEVAPAKLGGFEVDIREADGGGELVEHVLAADEQPRHAVERYGGDDVAEVVGGGRR